MIDVKEARERIGTLMGLGRPISYRETARMLRMAPASGSHTVRKWEADGSITGPASVALEVIMGGAIPPTVDEMFVPRGRRCPSKES